MSIMCANDWVTMVCEACGVDPGLVEKVVIEATPLDVIRVNITVVANQEFEKVLTQVTSYKIVSADNNEHE